MVVERTIGVPRGLMYPVASLLWRLHLVREAPPGIIEYMRWPWVLDLTRVRELLGFEPAYSTRETARIMLSSHGYRLVGAVDRPL